MKIFIVATYPAMEQPIKLLIKKYKNIEIKYGIGKLEEGLKLAQNAINNDFDAIISRGGTARLLKKHLEVPIIDAKPSGNDLLKSILIAKNKKLKAAIISYANITDGATEIIELLDLDFKIHYIKDGMDLTSLLIKLKSLGYELILGDSLAVEIASDLGFQTVLFQSSYDTIKNNIDYAIMILNQINKISIIDKIKSEFFTNELSDYCILLDNKIIYYKFNHFGKLPISFGKIINIKFNYESNTNQNLKKNLFRVDNFNIEITHVFLDGKTYYLLKFTEEKIKNQYDGVYEFKLKSNLLPVKKSSAMKSIFSKIEDSIRLKKAIIMIKNNNTTLTEILNQIECSSQKYNLYIDMKEFNFSDFFKLNTKKYTFILFNNIIDPQDILKISSLQQNSTSIFIILLDSECLLTKTSIDLDYFYIPNTKDRKEDLIQVFENHINYYHDNKGFSALKVQKDMFDKNVNLLDSNLDYLIEVLIKTLAEVKSSTISYDDFMKNYKDNTTIGLDIVTENKSLEEIEKEYIKKYLVREEYNQSKVADILKVSRSTLWRKIKKYNL